MPTDRLSLTAEYEMLSGVFSLNAIGGNEKDPQRCKAVRTGDQVFIYSRDRDTFARLMKYAPNALTIIRIIVTPVLLVLLLKNTFWGQTWALGLFVLASISDYLDGKLARYFMAGSRLGQFLDPVADKVLVLGTFVVLSHLMPASVPWWCVALIALRDFVVTGLRLWAEAHGRSMPTLRAAKYKTTAQLVFLIGTLLLLSVSKAGGAVGALGISVLDSPILFILLLIVVLVTLYTGMLYLTKMQYKALVEEDG